GSYTFTITPSSSLLQAVIKTDVKVVAGANTDLGIIMLQ
ncbi:MAG: hypothetical protein ACI9CZ_001212, partial [Flavobacterium sp.]